MRLLTLLTLSVLLGLAAGTCDAQDKAKSKTESEAKEASPSPFARAMRANFNAWDRNKDGKLTVDEVDLAFRNPQVKGDAAAAIAVVKNSMRDYIDVQVDKGNKDPAKNCPPFTLEQLQAYEAKAAKGKRKQPHDQLFADLKRKLDNTSRELFPEKAPKLNAIQQGELGDCYFMSMVGAFVHMHPRKLGQMIEEIDGKKAGVKKYVVHFANKPKPIEIAAPTEAEIALNSSAEKNGLWLTVIEKAFGAEMTRRRPKGERLLKGSELIGHGGAAGDAVAVLTGNSMNDVDWNDPHLAAHLFKAVSQRCLIATAVREKAKPPAPLHTGHVYAVLGYDMKGQVTLFDPTGINFSPKKGPAGIENGYEIKAGVFTLPLRDFVPLFDGICYEDKTTKAHEPKKKKG